MAINKFTINLSFTEVEKVVTKLRKLRDDNVHILSDEVDGYISSRTYNSTLKEYEDVEPHVERWRVTSAESTLAERGEIAEIISWFTGEAPEEDQVKIEALAAARVRLDAEIAAEKAAAEAEVD